MSRITANPVARNLALLVVLLLLIWSCTPHPVLAQSNSNCAPHEVIVERLGQRYAETIQMMGLGGERLFELYASPATGSWSIVVTTPDGVACLVASGNSFEQVPVLNKGDGL